VCLTRLKRAAEALPHLERALELATNDANVVKHKGVAHRALEEWQAAAACFRRALSLNPKMADAHLLLADVLERLADPTAAFAAYERFLELTAHMASPQVTHAKQRVAALRGSLGGTTSPPSDAREQIATGQRHVAEGRLEQALAAFKAAEQAALADPAGPFLRGNVLLQMGRAREAAQAFEEAVRRDATMSGAWCNLGYCQMLEGEFAPALRSCDQAARLAPEDAQVWLNRANALCELQRPEEALRSAERALELAPSSHEAWGNRGRALAMLGRLDEALVAFERGCELGPTNATHWVNRATVLAKLGRADEAVPHLRRALHIDPTQPLARQLSVALFGAME
jgi:tetratricopeptide (TPR) repeat protein